MIEVALHTFLTTTSNGTTSQSARQAARTALATAIGNRVWIGRKPQSSITPALTILRMSTDRYDDLPGEPTYAASVIDFTLWAREDQYSPTQLLAAADNLRASITQYRGLMGTVNVFGSTILGDNMLTPVPPADGSDHWIFGYTMDVKIHHAQAEVVALT